MDNKSSNKLLNFHQFPENITLYILKTEKAPSGSSTYFFLYTYGNSYRLFTYLVNFPFRLDALFL